MRAIYLTQTGEAQQAFEIREFTPTPPKEGEIGIKVDAFGLNFADVMARLGLYRDAPPMPAVLGYEVVGHVKEVGAGVSAFQEGDRVVAFTRFGGYAEHAITDFRAATKIPSSLSDAKALALPTQYGTAYFMAAESVQLHEGEHVLIHAAAGGVGTALVQWAVHKGCIIYGTAGSEKKLEYLRNMGVQHPINYREQDFQEVIAGIRGKAGLDVVFDPVGGKSVKKGFKLLAPGGKLICFGGSSLTEAKNIFAKIKVGLGFGFYHPVSLLSKSQSLIGVNMLRIADHKPETLQRVMKAVIQTYESGIFDPVVGGEFPAEKIADAHEFLASRQSMGKVAVSWKN